jgi:alpha-maltose-1-phosphate synthase
MSDRIRVLLIAEAANPEWVSVPLEGWQNARAISQVADVHLVTQIRNREAILRAGVSEREFTAIDSEKIAARIHWINEKIRGGAGKGWTTGTALTAISYIYFERLLWKRFGPDIRGGKYDLVHRVTPLSPTTPSIIAGKCRRAGVPFVIGPLNGGVPWPRWFQGARRREKEWLSYVRDAYRLLPYYRSTRRNAGAIIVGSRDTLAQMPQRYPAKFTRRIERPVSAPVRAVFVGRLVPYKGADMLLEAAAGLVKTGRLSLEIIGDGPEMPLLRERIEREGLGQGVTLAGWVQHKDLQDHLVNADLFCFPSIREFGGAVVLEAMALGLVPIVVDYGGPGELVTDATGYRIPIGPREAIVASLRVRLEQLVADPSHLRSMGERARRRAHTQFTWPAKALQILEVYRWALGRRAKPDFGTPLPDPPETDEGR